MYYIRYVPKIRGDLGCFDLSVNSMKSVSFTCAQEVYYFTCVNGVCFKRKARWKRWWDYFREVRNNVSRGEKRQVGRHLHTFRTPPPYPLPHCSPLTSWTCTNVNDEAWWDVFLDNSGGFPDSVDCTVGHREALGKLLKWHNSDGGEVHQAAVFPLERPRAELEGYSYRGWDGLWTGRYIDGNVYTGTSLEHRFTDRPSDTNVGLHQGGLDTATIWLWFTADRLTGTSGSIASPLRTLFKLSTCA